jgi:hypothetical protein
MLSKKEMWMARAFINKWKERLKLSEWNIGVGVDYYEEDKSFAEVRDEFYTKRALILLSKKAFINERELEDTIVHELCHLILRDWSKSWEEVLARERATIDELLEGKEEIVVHKIVEGLLR